MASGSSLVLASPEPQASCRTDFLSCTYAFKEEDQEEELFAYLNDVAESILPVGGWEGPTRAKHFERLYRHKSGITFEWTPLSSELSTAGRASAGMSGSPFGALDAKERSDLLVDLRYMEGFKRCTRWDPQITVLDPERTVEQVCADVRDGNLWAARYGTQNAYGSLNQNGEWRSPPTQYFGSRDSNIRLRIYDHGAKQGWNRPSLRVECQLRKQAADDHFRRLTERCKAERDTPPILIAEEMRTVKDALAQHADLRDTSKWAGRPRPRKWRQEAPVPGWWERMLEHKHDPLALTHKQQVEWERSRQVGCEQYGRKMALSVLHRSLMGDGELTYETAVLFAEMCSQLKAEDLKEVLGNLPESKHKAARKAFNSLRDIGAQIQEAKPS